MPIGIGGPGRGDDMFGGIPAAQTGGILYTIFNTYGDTDTGRTLATQALINILTFIYGAGYEYRLDSLQRHPSVTFVGNGVTNSEPKAYVDSNGRLRRSFVEDYNDVIDANIPPIEDGYIAAQNFVGSRLIINFIQRENPSYEYPWYYEYRIRPYSTIDRFLYNPLGVQNHKYNGSKLTGNDINIDSAETVDGGPVVKITKVNQNQIVFSNNNITTARSNTSGLPARQLTSRVTSGGTGTISNTTTDIPVNDVL